MNSETRLKSSVRSLSSRDPDRTRVFTSVKYDSQILIQFFSDLLYIGKIMYMFIYIIILEIIYPECGVEHSS